MRHRDIPSRILSLLSLLGLAFGFTAAKELLPGEVLWQEGVAYRSEGRELQSVGEMQRAITAYRQAVEVNPKYAEAYNDLGVALESTGDVARAEEAYKTALRLKPELAAAHSNLALLYEEAGRTKEAAEHWAARVLQGPPNDPWVVKARRKLGQDIQPVSPPVQEQKPQKSVKPKAEKQPRQLKQPKQLKQQKEADEEARRQAERRAAEIQKEIAAQSKKQKAVKPPAPVEKKAPAPKDALAVAEEYAREKSRARKATVKELYDRAVNSMREGQYQEAVDQFKQILLLNPGHRDAQRGLERAEKALAKQLP